MRQSIHTENEFDAKRQDGESFEAYKTRLKRVSAMMGYYNRVGGEPLGDTPSKHYVKGEPLKPRYERRLQERHNDELRTTKRPHNNRAHHVVRVVRGKAVRVTRDSATFKSRLSFFNFFQRLRERIKGAVR